MRNWMNVFKPIFAFFFICSLFMLQGVNQKTFGEELNTAPSLDNSSIIEFTPIQEEDFNNAGNLISDLLMGRVTDTDVGDLSGIAIVLADNSNGEWQCFVGGTWWNIGNVSESLALQLFSDAKIRFVPKVNWNGTALISFRAWDRTNGASNRSLADTNSNGGNTSFSSNIATARITVLPVNDAPYFTDCLGGKALSFDGSGQFAQLNSVYTGMNSSFTYEAWVYNKNVYATWARIFDFGNNLRAQNSPNYNIELSFAGNTGKMHFEAFTNPGNIYNNRYYIDTSEVFPQNQWVHVATVYDADKKKGYIYWNGVLKASGTMDLFAIPFMERKYNYIGRSNWEQDADFFGYMKDIRIWNIARSQAEIQSNMNYAMSGSESDLTEYYRVDEGSGTVLNNLVNDTNDIDIVNATWTNISGLNINASTQGNIPVSIAFMVNDIEDDANNLTVSAVSDNQTLVPDGNLSIDGTGSLKNILINPATNQIGSATITLTLRDSLNESAQTSFQVNIYPPLAPIISSQPVSITKENGETATFSINASVSGGGGLSYQWQKSLDNAQTWDNIVGANSDSYTTNALLDADNGTQYRCVVTNSLGDSTANTISQTATLTVKAAEKQATPSFSPAGGAIAFGNTVIITSAGADHIYYTIDGTEPTTSAGGSTLEYMVPVTVDTAMNIKAIAVKTGTIDSTIGSASYIQAATADLTNIVLSGAPDNFSFKGDNYNYNIVTVANSINSTTVISTGIGNITVDGTPVISGTASGAISLTAGIEKTITVVAKEVGKTAKTYSIKVTREMPNVSGAPSSSNEDSGDRSTPDSKKDDEIGLDILINGKPEILTIVNTMRLEEKTVTTILVDGKKVEEKLQQVGINAVVTIPVIKDTDVVIGTLNGQTVKNMEAKDAILEIKTQNVTYSIPALQINIDAVSEKIGKQVELKDITVNVKISEPTSDKVKLIEDVANKNNYQLVIKPVEFEITCSFGEKNVEVSKFKTYVERIIAIPDDINPEKITTGIILNPDGTFSHVPTTITIINGKYFARINSLTNSTYSIIYNPKAFNDVKNHWAKDAVNDISSRLIINGISVERFEPDGNVTRGEFAAIVVKALGLMHSGIGRDTFSDVSKGTLYYDAVSIAHEYHLVSGYSNGKFGPNEKITREQALTIIARAMKVTGLRADLAENEGEGLLEAFSDTDMLADYAKKSISTCKKAGIVSGRNAKLLAPKDNITRAETAVLIRRLLQLSKLI